MRLVFVLCLMALCMSSAAMADPANLEPKDWSFVHGEPREIIPEQEPNDECPGQRLSCGDVIEPAFLDPGNLDWYQFEVAAAGTWVTIGVEGYQGSSWDAYLELYSDDCVTLLASDDDSGPGLFPLIVNYVAPYAGLYNVKVRGFGGSSSGAYRMYVNCTDPIPPPENDTCDTALPIDRCTTGSLNGDVTYATNDYSPPSGCTGYSANGKDVVYYVDLLAGDQVSLVYTQLLYDTSFYVVTDCVNMDCVAGADDTLTGEPEVINFVAASDGRYYIILDAYGTDTGGAWTLDYSIDCPTPPTEEACCFDDGTCQMLLANRCTEAGGEPMGEGTTCDTVNCEIVPANQTTWGQIKSDYR